MEKLRSMNSSELSHIIRKKDRNAVIIDTRSFLEYNTSHISSAVNICCSKLVKRRLQQGKVSIADLLTQACDFAPDSSHYIIVYDQCTTMSSLQDTFLLFLLQKMVPKYQSVTILSGGFLEFQSFHPSLVNSKSFQKPTLMSLSQPCLPVTNLGPTRILPFMYLGSQIDALDEDVAKRLGVSYVLNASVTCPKPSHISQANFERIPVNDSYTARLLPHFQRAFMFLDKVRESSSCVLVHCLAGISRSPTLAIAYVMRHLSLSSEEAYRYVQEKRPNISPNFNFLGQLLEYERLLKNESESLSPIQIEDGKEMEFKVTKLESISRVKSVSPSLQIRFKSAINVSVDVDADELKVEKLEDPGAKPSSPQVIMRKFRGKTPQKLSLSSTHNPITIQSPTTALANLSFASTVASSEPTFAQIPISSIDKLCFTSCVAGTKRPQSNAVHESSAKRALVRPNSIALPHITAQTIVHARRARSLENLSDSPQREDYTLKSRLGSALGVSPTAQLGVVDLYRTQSNSSVSSNGSISSIRGSLEMIPVS